ncbi:LRP2-binding protein, partial [Geodia barretti]
EEKAQRGISTIQPARAKPNSHCSVQLTGNADAQFSLGQYHYSQGNHETALRYFSSAEGGGSAQASYQLGVMFYDGVDAPQNPKRGFQHMLKAAQSGNSVGAGAQYNIGRAFYQGYGVAQSDEEAERWWLKAGEGRRSVEGGEGEKEEEQGGEWESVVRAQNTLGMFYSRQETQDLGKSLHWHSCAAENGHLESMAAAGLMRLNGRGCPRDVTAGLQLLKNAAAGGSLYAAGLLALHYFTSKLFSKSTETALSVCELQSDAGSLSVLERKGMSLACFTLARSLQLGQAVSQDLDKAIQYFTKAKGYDKDTVAELHTQVIHGLL